MSSSGMGRDVHSFMLSTQRFLCRPRRRPPSKVPRRMVLERLSWRVTCPNHASIIKFPSLDSCRKRFLWTHKEVDLALHPVSGLVLQRNSAEKFSQALGFESLDPYFRASRQGSCFTAIEEDGGDKRLVKLITSFSFAKLMGINIL